jgi:branched-chain amino acid transport system ATP-binding protein
MGRNKMNPNGVEMAERHDFGEPMLRTDVLVKEFGAVRAVDRVSIAVNKGSLHCIIGPNGAGKTTLFNLLTKDLVPTEGRIYLEGRDISALQSHEVSRLGVGRSYQITSVFRAQSVLDNVWVASYRKTKGGGFNFWRGLGRYEDVRDQAMANLELVGLRDQAGRPAGELSYGDQRLLEIAVTLSTSPKLVLLDEPVNGLSQSETAKVAELIRGLVPKYTVVMIEHKIDVVMKVSDCVTVMNFGEVIAEGKPDEIRTNENVKTAYFGV